MTELAPDIAELQDATAKIDEIETYIDAILAKLEDLNDLGPRDVLAPVATHYRNLVELEDAIERARLRVYHMKEYFQFHVLPPLFRDASVDTVKTLNGYTMKMIDDVSVSIPSDKKGDAYEWLSQNGYGDIIQSTVNSSTLKASVKVMLKDGMVIPEDVFKLNLFPRFTMTKSSRSIPSAV